MTTRTFPAGTIALVCDSRPHIALDAGASLIGTDGTTWSHAAQLGLFVQGRGSKSVVFDLDAATMKSFVRNFAQGYPQKVPVDYDHGSTSGVADGTVPVPKAGTVVEMKAVLEEADITPEIQAVIERAQAERARIGLTTPLSPFGLWIRWAPTNRALGMVREREYTEMSIAFGMDVPDNRTGEGQGPTITAVALTNTPFLQEMVSVAASRGADGTGAVTPEPETRSMNTKSPWQNIVAAFTGKPVATDDEATAEFSRAVEEKRTADAARETEVVELRGFRDVVAAELAGAAEPTAALSAIRTLRSTVEERDATIAQLQRENRERLVELTLRGFENKLTPPAKKLYAAQLSRELEAGVELDKSETIAALGSLPDIPGLSGQSTGSGESQNGAGEGLTEDAVLLSRMNDIMANDPEVSKIPDKNTRMLKAISLARTQLARKA